jgi:hypothetical protein
MTADDAVVRDVAVGEEVVVTADDRFFTRQSGAVHRGKLAEGVVVPDLKVSGLDFVFQVLGLLTDGGVGKETVVFADASRPKDGDVMLHPGAIANFHIGTDDRVGADVHILANFGGRINDGGGVNHASKAWASGFSGR